MIRQHIYGRTEKGLYITGPDDPNYNGMDTIAKSKGLPDEFVATVLKDHCVYEPPDKLAGYIEENRDQYPINYYCFWAPSGELVVGRTMFTRPGIGAAGSGAGGTGEAAGQSYTTHNFIVPPQEASGFVATYMNLPYITDFTRRQESADAQLPEIPAFHYDVDKCRLEYGESALLKYGVNDAVFKTMLFALMEAIRTGKRVYVVPNVRTGQLHEAARVLIKFLAAALPYAFRRRLGYATYLKRDVEPAGVNLCFLEGGYPAYTLPSRLGEFVFDFVSNTIWTPEAHGRPPVNSIYIQGAWAARKDDRRKFYEFVNGVTHGGAGGAGYSSGPAAGQPAGASVGVVNEDTLDALAALWYIGTPEAEDAAQLYRQNRMFILNTLCESVRKRNTALLNVVKGVFEKAIDTERRDMADGAPGGLAGKAGKSGKARGSAGAAPAGVTPAGVTTAGGTPAGMGYFPEAMLLSKFAAYAEGFKSNDTDADVTGFCVDTLNAARAADHVDYINSFFSLAMESPRVFKKIQAALTERYGGMFDGVVFRYVMTRLKACDTIQKLTAEVEFWWSNKPSVLADPDVTEAFRAHLKNLFLAAQDKPAEGARFHSRMEYVLRNTSSKDDKRVIYDLSRALLETVDRVVLDSLSGENITYEALQALKIDSDALKSELKYKTLDALKGFLCSEQRYAEEKAIKTLREQGPHAFKQTSSVIKRILADRIFQENYDRIVEIHTEPGPKDVGDKVDFKGLFEFVNTNKNRGECCNLIKWAFRNNRFSGPNFSEFNNTVVEFFNGFTPKEFRVVLKNYAYLYQNPDALPDGEKNLKHIIDVFRERNAVIPRPQIGKGIKGLGIVLLVAVSIVLGIVLLFVFAATLLRV